MDAANKNDKLTNKFDRGGGQNLMYKGLAARCAVCGRISFVIIWGCNWSG